MILMGRGRPKGYGGWSNKQHYLNIHGDENGKLPPRKKGRKTPDEKEELYNERYEEEKRLWKLRLKNNEELNAGVIRLGDYFYFNDSPALIEPSLPAPEETKGDWKEKNIVKSLNIGFTEEEYEFVKRESERLYLSKNNFLKMKIFTYMYRKPSVLEKKFYEETPRFPCFSKKNRLKPPKYKRHYYDVKHKGEVYGQIGEGTPEAIEEERLRTRKWERDEMRRKEDENRARNPIWYAHQENLQNMEEYDINERGIEGIHFEEFTEFSPDGMNYRYIFKEDNPIVLKVYVRQKYWFIECPDYGIKIQMPDDQRCAFQSAKMTFHYTYRYLLFGEGDRLFCGEIKSGEAEIVRERMRENVECVEREWKEEYRVEEK